MRPTPRLLAEREVPLLGHRRQTPVFPRDTGSVSYDSTRVASAGPSEYHSVRRDTFDADGALEVLPFTSLKVGYSSLGERLYTSHLREHERERVPRVARHDRQSVRDGAGPLRESLTRRRRIRARGTRRGRRARRDASLRRRRSRPAALHADRQRSRPAASSASTLRPASVATNTRTARMACSNYDTNQYSVGFDVTPDDDRQSVSGAYGWERFDFAAASRATANNAEEQANPSGIGRPIMTATWTIVDFTYTNRFIERTSHPRHGGLDAVERHLSVRLVPGSPLVVPEQLPPVKNELLRGEVDVELRDSRAISGWVPAYWYDDYDVEDFALGPETISGIALPPPNPTNPLDADQCAPAGLSIPPLHRPYRLRTAHLCMVTGTRPALARASVAAMTHRAAIVTSSPVNRSRRLAPRPGVVTGRRRSR